MKILTILLLATIARADFLSIPWSPVTALPGSITITRKATSGVLIVAKPPICKTVTQPEGDGCNTCEVTICHDKYKQWEEPGQTCTAMNCYHRIDEKPYNPADWQ